MSLNSSPLANALRFLAIDAVERAKSGHPGMPMGMADVATVLFHDHLRFDANDPNWPDRDRFVLSAGHGSMLLYALLYLTGYKDMTIEEIKNFRQLGSKTPGHPEFGHTQGVETTTGPLGQGLATAVGMAIAERHLAARFGKNIVDHYTYVIASDGDLMEGISHEAGSFAGHQKLGKLIVLFDDNEISIDGPTSLSTSENVCTRFDAYGWHTIKIDGHDHQSISRAIAEAKSDPRPSLIACRTIIGFGSPKKAGSASSHGSPLGADEIISTREALSWPHAEFHIPAEILSIWRACGQKGTAENKSWQARLAELDSKTKSNFIEATNSTLPKDFSEFCENLRQKLASDSKPVATRVASGQVISALTEVIPHLIGGSADLTPSNNTRASNAAALSASAPTGRYLHFGIREHAMAAAMNGMALHGGIIPFGGTFLIFSDYCRPAIRLSALMKQRVIYIMTHDSIGLGEDGPTHQPIEQLACLRAIPGLQVFRPADAVETAEAWELALNSSAPSLLALSRQNLPLLRSKNHEQNLSARGAYCLHENSSSPDVTLWASGSEVHLALEASQQLEKNNISVRVISIPSHSLFEQQTAAYRAELCQRNTLHIAIEAGIRQSWDSIIGSDGIFIGMKNFGASAPSEKLFAHFGITAQAIIESATQALNNKNLSSPKGKSA